MWGTDRAPARMPDRQRNAYDRIHNAVNPGPGTPRAHTHHPRVEVSKGEPLAELEAEPRPCFRLPAPCIPPRKR